MKIQKHCVGIDISKSTFTGWICSEFENQDLIFSEVKCIVTIKSDLTNLIDGVGN